MQATVVCDIVEGKSKTRRQLTECRWHMRASAAAAVRTAAVCVCVCVCVCVFVCVCARASERE